MTRDEVVALVSAAVAEYASAVRPGEVVQLDETTPLLGAQSGFESMDVVNIVLDVEQALADRGCAISLADERALSRRESPFRNIGTLADHVCALLEAIT